MYTYPLQHLSLRGLSATDIGGGLSVIPGFNSKTGKYIWQPGDIGTGVAKKFNRPMPQVEWQNMRALNPQTRGRPNEAKWGWEVYIGEEVVVPPQWLADIGWSGEVVAPPGTVSPGVETVVIDGGQVKPGTGTGIQPAGPTQPGQPATQATTKTASMSQWGIYALAALAGLGIAAFLVMRKQRAPRRLSKRPSTRAVRQLPARRSSARPSARSRR